MNITAEEKLMYEAMKAVYDSGIPVSFKGSMVLKACQIEAGYSEETGAVSAAVSRMGLLSPGPAD